MLDQQTADAPNIELFKYRLSKIMVDQMGVFED